MSKQFRNVVRTQQSAFSSQSLQVGSRTGGGGVMAMMTVQEKKTTVQVEKIHSSNGTQLNNVRPLFNHAKLLFKRTDCYDGEVDEDCRLERKGDLVKIIKKVLGEIVPGSESGIHSSTLAVARVLQAWEWHEAIVITLAAFSVKLGDFKLMSRMYKNDSLAESIGLLKDLDTPDDDESLFATLTTVIDVMIKVTEKVVSFAHYLDHSESLSSEDPPVVDVLSTFPVAGCWIIMTAITATTCVSITSSSSAILQLSKCCTILKELHHELEKKTSFLDQKRVKEAYKKLRKEFRINVTVDISMTIRSLIFPDDDEGKLYCGRENREVDFSVLQGNTVLLLITRKNHNSAELEMLESMYEALMKKNCRIVWVQVTEESFSSTTTKTKTKTKTKTMTPGKQRSWYCVSQRSSISEAAIMFFRNDLHFKGSPTLVCLDTKHEFSPMNVLHMLRIWREKAAPFSKTIATELWRKNTYLTLDLLVDNVAEYVPKWQKYIVVYGGDVEGKWIRSFKEAIEGFEKETKTSYECIYVGKSCVQSKKNWSSASELGFGCVMEEEKMSAFWTRLESMMYAHMELEMDEDSDMMVKIKKIISYDKSKSSWAVIFKGNTVFQVVSGSTVLRVLQCESWESQVTEHGGVEKALEFQIDNGQETEHHCIRLEFPCSNAGKTPSSMRCPDCCQEMVALTVFVCCKDAIDDEDDPSDTATRNGPDPGKSATNGTTTNFKSANFSAEITETVTEEF